MTVELEVNGVLYGGFQSGDVRLGIEQLSSSFTLRYADVWERGGTSVPIQEGDRCKLSIDGRVVIDGWVDEDNEAYDATSDERTVQGRSLAGDLVDCSVIGKPASWTDSKLSVIAGDLCKNFLVQPLILGAEPRKFGKFSVKKGEKIGDAVQRAARMRGMLVYSAGADLVFARAGATSTTTVIKRGTDGNVLRGERRRSLAERFSDYHFVGQTRGRDDVNGVAASQLHGVVKDNGVPRYRPLRIVRGGADEPGDLGELAIRERNRRAGRGERWIYTVPGFANAEGLWEPNVRARVTDPRFDIDEELLIADVSFSFGLGKGRRTKLELTRPAAFELGDYPVRRRRTT